MGRLIFLGTGAALPTADRGNTALAVRGEDPRQWLQVDCGGDPYRALLRAGIGPDGVRDLLITHAHIDHLGGLPSLIEGLRLGGRTAPLRLLALPEVMRVAHQLLALYSYELTLDSWTFAISYEELEPGREFTLAGIPARTDRMDHALPSVGVRLELPGGAVCYSCDTQPTPALPALGQGAALLITECTFLRGHEASARHSRHLTAIEAGEQAAAANARQLALVHLGVGDGWSADEARAQAASTFSGPILIPNDGDALDV
jgi:ribonuclease Z